jgi:hypothetical protein
VSSVEGKDEAAQTFPMSPNASTERREDVDTGTGRLRGIVAAAAAVGDLEVVLVLEPTLTDLLESPEMLPNALEAAVWSGKTEYCSVGHQIPGERR